jgi:hypothetical protein
MCGVHLWVTRVERKKMSIQPSSNLVMIGDQPLPCEPQPRRVFCFLVYSPKMQNMLTKTIRNQRNEFKLFLVLLHSAEELQTFKIYFGSELDTKRKRVDY